MAILVEILILVFTEQMSKLDILDKFLSAIASNAFASFFVLIAIFLIVHIAFIIFLNFIFSSQDDKNKNYIGIILSYRIKKIERNLVVFVCNLIDGIVALFYFIPDFFNTIGSLLLNQEGLFPNDDADTDENDKESNNKNNESNNDTI